MKIVLLLSLFFYASFVSAINNQETFLQANKLYQDKKFEEALTMYSKIQNKGSASWYNMGNCHYQLGHEADALACWQRAKDGASITLNKEIAYNIDVVLNEDHASHEVKGIAKLLMRMQHISTLFAQIVFLLMWICLFVVISLSKRRKKYKVATFILCAFIVPLGCLVAYKYFDHREIVAIAHTDAKLFAGPNEKYHVVGSVATKDQLHVYSKSDNWYKVSQGKQVGWVHSDALIML